MPNSKPFPSKEADLNTYFNLAITYLLTNAARLLVSPANQAIERMEKKPVGKGSL
jgi:hypothetical protein